MLNKHSGRLVALIILVAFGGLAQADEAENMIKYRKAAMKALAGHMGASAMLVKGKVKFKDDLAMHANALASLTKDMMKMFPEGSDFGETNAKEDIWKDKDKFKKVAKDSENAAAAFAKVVGSGDKAKIGAAFRKVGESCKACHKPFRVKK